MLPPPNVVDGEEGVATGAAELREDTAADC